jgi:hypothetical protein
MDSIRIGRSRHEITFVPGSSGHNFPLWRTGRWASLEQVMRPGVALDIGRALGDDCDRFVV